MLLQKQKITIFCFIILVLISIYHVAFAEKVQLKISSKITANAEFYPGEKDQAAILILHGFLLNHQFQTVQRLATSLHELGYTVLTPSLSLGINKRKQSLACEAIHLHSMQTDIAEIDKWVNWLVKKVNKKIILFGHSAGSVHLIHYLSAYPTAEVTQLFLLTIPDFGKHGPFSYETKKDEEKAQNLLLENNNMLSEYGLSYCKKYTTTAKNYLSYFHLNKPEITSKLTRLAIDISLIYGTADTIVDRQWNRSFAAKNFNIFPIEGANHFFDYEYEFSLLNIVEQLLSKKSKN